MTISWLPRSLDAEAALYLSIARAIAADISSGRLQAGDPLPPQRELAERLGVALGTVTRAYAEAERLGMVRGQGRRGTVVVGAGARRSSLAALLDTDGDLVDLAANLPAAPLDPDLGGSLKALARSAGARELLRYPPPCGLPRHRRAFAAWLLAQDVPAAAENVIVTAGAQHAIHATLAAVTRPGDELACEALTYPGVKVAAQALGLKLRGLPLDADGLLPDGLERLCRSRHVSALYTIPSLHNPTGVCLPIDRKRAIAQIAARHGVLLIEDEIHRPLARAPSASLLTIAPERTFVVTSASKTVAGGLRVGCVVGPPSHHEALRQAVQTTLIAASPLPAELFAIWLEDGTVARTVAARRREARSRQKLARAQLGTTGLTIRGDPDSPYLWLELPGRWPAARFASAVRERGVAVAPADVFSVDSTRAPNALRLALSAPPARQLLARGLQIVADLCQQEPRPALATL